METKWGHRVGGLGRGVSAELGECRWGVGRTLMRMWFVVKPKVAVNVGSPVLAVGDASTSCALASSEWPHRPVG